MNTIIITGGGSGIGRALTHTLAARGLRCLILGRRLNALEETRAAYPEQIQIKALDLAHDDAPQELLKALPEGTRVTHLVHNAAILEPVTSAANISRAAWRKHMAVNLDAPLFLTQALLPHMAEEARILHISSGAAHGAYRGWTSYCTSKAALFMLYQCLNLELSDAQIHVGSVRPGVVDTPMQDTVRQSDPDAFPNLPRFLDLKQSGKLATPEAVGKFLAWYLLDTPHHVFTEAERDYRDAHLDQAGGYRFEK